MDKTSKIIFAVLSMMIIGVVVFTYHRTIVRKDYVIFPDETGMEEPVVEEESLDEHSFSAPTSSSSEENQGE